VRTALATAVLKSGNKKIGRAAATYAAQQSCPSSCVFKDGGGCYAENGQVFSGTTKYLNEAAAATGATALDVALEEAAAIDALEPDGRPMRLHTVGDCSTDETARIVSAASARYVRRGGGPVWTYTHAWRTVNRESWGKVSVLASCETTEDVFDARQRGYATALVVDEFPTRKRYDAGAYTREGQLVRAFEQKGEPLGQDVLPCPAQTSGATCTSCRLCFDDSKLRQRGYSIGFAVHGTNLTVKQAKRALSDPDDPLRKLTSRHLIPVYLADHPNATEQQIADALGLAKSSINQMMRKLEAESCVR
jgi:hypothetical protein